MSNFDEGNEFNSNSNNKGFNFEKYVNNINEFSQKVLQASKTKIIYFSKILIGIEDEFENEVKQKIAQMQLQGVQGRRKAILLVEDKDKQNFNPKIIHNYKPLLGNSLYFFNKDNKFRVFIWTIINSIHFYRFMSIVIVLSLIGLAIDSPNALNYSSSIFVIDLIINVIFSLEFVSKIISYGLIKNGDSSYFRDFNCVIEFVCLTFSLTYLIFSSVYSISSTQIISSLQFLKISRIIRSFRLISLSPMLQSSLNSLIKSVGQILILIFIGFVVLFMFTVVGLNYFLGLFYRCDFLHVPLDLQPAVTNKWDCLDYGGDWVTVNPNFDNFGQTLLVVFSMMTGEGWTEYLYWLSDSRYRNDQPIYNQSPHWTLFWMGFMIIAYFFLANLCISILTHNFKKEKSLNNNKEFKSDVQKEFYRILVDLFSVSVPKKEKRSTKLQKLLLKVIDSVYFEFVISSCIVSNILMLVLVWTGQSQQTKDYLGQVDNLFFYVFLVEVIFKLYVYRYDYFNSFWNVGDLIMVVTQLVNLILSNTLQVKKMFNTTILRAIRVLRVLRMLKQAKVFNRIFNLFLNSISGMVNVSVIYFLFVFIYSIIGMNIFPNTTHQNYINDDWNFENFFNAVLLLIRISTGENWNNFLIEYSKDRSLNFTCKYIGEFTYDTILSKEGCGSKAAYYFFISFYIISSMIIFQLFSVIISITAADTVFLNFETLSINDIIKFKEYWGKYDREGSGFMKVDNFHLFLYSLGEPLGINSKKNRNFMRFISVLDLTIYQKDSVFFYDVLIEIAKNSILQKTIEIDCRESRGENKFFEFKQYSDQKMLEYAVMSKEVNEIKHSSEIKKINPYYIEDKYYSYFKEIMSENLKSVFPQKIYLTPQILLASKKLVNFTKCYKLMKLKMMGVYERYEGKIEAAVLEKYYLNIQKRKNPHFMHKDSRRNKTSNPTKKTVNKRVSSNLNLNEYKNKNERDVTPRFHTFHSDFHK